MEQTFDAPVPQDMKPPEIEYVAPAPAAAAYAAPDPVAEYVAPSPVITRAAPAPVTEYVSFPPAVAYTARAPVIDSVVSAPADTYAARAHVTEHALTSLAGICAAPAPVTEYASTSPAAAHAHAAPTPGIEHVSSTSRHPCDISSSDRLQADFTCRCLCGACPGDQVRGTSDRVRVDLTCQCPRELNNRAGPPFGWELAIAGRSGSCLFFGDVHRFFKPQTHWHWIPRRLRRES